MLLSTAYFPPLEYIALIARDFTLSPDRVFPSHVTIEACESYVKQSYRNRCYILTSQGPEMLQVPVVHGERLISRILVDYSVPWIEKTKRAIDTAYFSTPWLEYYRDDLYSILDSRPERLIDLNTGILRFLLEKFSIAADISFTSEYEKEVPDDWRDAIHPKRPNTILADLGLGQPYYQVFPSKSPRSQEARSFGSNSPEARPFTPNLSSLDLLLSEGPSSLPWLKTI